MWYKYYDETAWETNSLSQLATRLDWRLSFSFTILGTNGDLLSLTFHSILSLAISEIENKLVLIIHATFNKCLVINQVKKKKASKERYATGWYAKQEIVLCWCWFCFVCSVWCFAMIFQKLIYISACFKRIEKSVEKRSDKPKKPNHCRMED